MSRVTSGKQKLKFELGSLAPSKIAIADATQAGPTSDTHMSTQTANVERWVVENRMRVYGVFKRLLYFRKGFKLIMLTAMNI